MVKRNGLQLVLAAACLCSPVAAQSTLRASVSSSGAQADQTSDRPAISADGRYVAFMSFSDNFIHGWNFEPQIYVHDRATGHTAIASTDSNGAQGAGYSTAPAISADGRYVAFASSATNLVANDTNGVTDIFVHDRVTGSTTRVSLDSSGNQANGSSTNPSISADGRVVAFVSHATNLAAGETDGEEHIYAYDTSTGRTTLVSADSNGVPENGASDVYFKLSADGRYIAFASDATNLVANDTNGLSDVFVHDLSTGATVRASVDSSGAQSAGDSTDPAISADGRYVAFTSWAANLVQNDTNFTYDVFVHDMLSGTTVRASVDSNGVQGNHESGTDDFMSISDDGRFVAFQSLANNLTPEATNGWANVFIHDVLTGQTTRASVDPAGMPSDNNSHAAAISGDGQFVAFQSSATNLVAGDTNGFPDVFVRALGDWSAFTPLCFGDGSSAVCPCFNFGLDKHGCDNSAATGGAVLTGTGVPSLAADTVVLTATGELPTSLSIFAQGQQLIMPVAFGDGVRCVGGSLKRLYAKSAVAGTVSAPSAGDPSISARSAALGDTIPMGSLRYYYTYYRDASASFCPDPLGSTFNATSSVGIVWNP